MHPCIALESSAQGAAGAATHGRTRVHGRDTCIAADRRRRQRRSAGRGAWATWGIRLRAAAGGTLFPLGTFPWCLWKLGVWIRWLGRGLVWEEVLRGR